MSERIKIHDLLLSIGGPNVYLQAPSNIFMKYPAIKYEENKIENIHANDLVYYQKKSYTITVISKDVNENIVYLVSKLPQCSFDRRYVKDNLYHSVFDMYY
jgi:hypothetical protein